MSNVGAIDPNVVMFRWQIIDAYASATRNAPSLWSTVVVVRPTRLRLRLFRCPLFIKDGYWARENKGGKRKHASEFDEYTTGPRVFAQPLNEFISAVALETLGPAGHTNEQTRHLNYCNQSHS